MTDLKTMKFEPRDAADLAIDPQEYEGLVRQLPGWEIVSRDGVDRLRRVFTFGNFQDALAFTNRVGELAEKHDHHPELITEWGRVTVTWWTHAIRGLHMNDFIMAAQTDQLV